MKVNAVTSLPSAPMRFAVRLAINRMDFAVLTKLTVAMHSIMMSQGAKSPVIRRC